jgi:hypothetical protein
MQTQIQQRDRPVEEAGIRDPAGISDCAVVPSSTSVRTVAAANRIPVDTFEIDPGS